MFEVYKIQNKINGKIYVGITTQSIDKRFKAHLKEVEAGSTFILHNAIRSYGKDNFFITLLEEAESVDKLKEREKYWISLFKSNLREFGYNMTEGGDGTFGRLHSDDTKDLIRKAKQVLVKCTNILTNEISYYDSITIAAKATGVSPSKLSCLHKVSNEATYRDFKYEFTKPDKKVKVVVDQTEKIKKLHEGSAKWKRENSQQFSDSMKKAKESVTKAVLQLDLNGNIVAEFRNKVDAAASFNKSVSAIQHCLKGRNETAYGYKWKFKD